MGVQSLRDLLKSSLDSIAGTTRGAKAGIFLVNVHMNLWKSLCCDRTIGADIRLRDIWLRGAKRLIAYLLQWMGGIVKVEGVEIK